MDLKVNLFQTVTGKNRLIALRTARISEETQFQETIGKVSVLSGPSTGLTARDVQALSAKGCKLLVTIPTNLQDFFPNMIGLRLKDCGLKAISRNDLKGLRQLIGISFTGLKIKELPSDLFADMVNLEVIEFKNNRIQFIGKDIFNHLEGVKYIDLGGNPGIDAIYATEEYGDIDDPENRVYTLNDLNLLINKTFDESPELIQDLLNVVRFEDFKDFSIKVGQKEFKVHKLMLAARCPTLAEMIKRTPDADELILKDIDEHVFEIILDFIYHDKLPTIVESAEKLFVAAGKLKLEKLKNHVAKWILPIINGSNAIKFLQLASVYNSDEIKVKCIVESKKLLRDATYSYDDDIYDNFEVLKVIVEEKKKADERIQKVIDEFKKMKV